MSVEEIKPLKWSPTEGVGYIVVRRPDGGMQVTFKDLSLVTVEHWRAFALDHLLDSDRLTRNLYDLRTLKEIPEDAARYAIEVNNDPSVRNIRLAVLVSNEKVHAAVQKIAALTGSGGVEMAVFTDLDKAEAWLDRPLTYLV